MGSFFLSSKIFSNSSTLDESSKFLDISKTVSLLPFASKYNQDKYGYRYYNSSNIPTIGINKFSLILHIIYFLM